MPWAINGQVSTDELPGGKKITNAQYAAAIEGVINGKLITIDGGFAVVDPPEPEQPPEPQPPTLPEVKISLKAIVDAIAEAERSKYITSGSGQAMTYMQKSNEASAFLAATNPVPSDYPLISAEIGITAPTLAEVAAIVNSAYVQWQQIGAAIEAVRLGTKVRIEAATAVDEAQAAAASAIWP
jgi:hypothetical protein